MTRVGGVLCCVFSYNHAVLLRNCVASVRGRFPSVDVLVLDDSSDDPGVSAVLDTLGTDTNTSVLRGAVKRGDPARAWSLDGDVADLTRPHALLHDAERERVAESCLGWGAGKPRASRHGCFYLHQKLAMRYAIQRGYDFAWFIEADMQLVAGDDAWLGTTLAKFDHDPAVCQLAVQFLLRPGRFEFELLRGLGVYQPDRSYNSSGLLHLGRLRERPELVDAVCDEAPAGNLKLTSYRWDRLGATCWFDAYPVQAHVPWPDAFREGRAALEGGTPAIAPLAGRALSAWRSRDPAIPPLAEYFLSLNYEPDLPGPPWWYNPAFTDRYLDLCREHERADRAVGTSVVRWREGRPDQPPAHYWQPTAEEAASAAQPTPPAVTPPKRLRDRLRWFKPLVWGFSGYKALRMHGKRRHYRAFCRRVARERELVLSGRVPDASPTQRRRG